MKRIFMTVLVCLSLGSVSLRAQEAAGQKNAEEPKKESYYVFAPGVFQPLQIPREKVEVRGLCLGLLANRHDVISGWNLAPIATMVNKEMTGFSLSLLVNWAGGTVDGCQVAGFGNYVNGDFKGAQIAFFANVNGEPCGSTGFQLALYNEMCGSSSGAQVGLVNVVRKFRGAQVGLVNVADDLFGCQLGLINVNAESPISFMPVFNCRF